MANPYWATGDDMLAMILPQSIAATECEGERMDDAGDPQGEVVAARTDSQGIVRILVRDEFDAVTEFLAIGHDPDQWEESNPHPLGRGVVFRFAINHPGCGRGSGKDPACDGCAACVG